MPILPFGGIPPKSEAYLDARYIKKDLTNTVEADPIDNTYGHVNIDGYEIYATFLSLYTGIDGGSF